MALAPSGHHQQAEAGVLGDRGEAEGSRGSKGGFTVSFQDFKSFLRPRPWQFEI